MKKMMGALLAMAALAWGQDLRIAPSPPAQNAALALIITYRCPPPRRAGFRQYMTEFGLPRFERWKQSGVIQNYRFLFNSFVDVDDWDAMALLSFADDAQVAKWAEVEKINPGGLARDALEIAWPLNTYSAVLVNGASASPQNSSNSIFFVVPYDGTEAEYRDFANSCLAPQANAWMREGVLASCSIFRNRYPGGKRWQGLMVIEYKDVQAFSRRDEVDAKVRAQLENDPAWRAAAEKGRSVSPREPVIASALR